MHVLVVLCPLWLAQNLLIWRRHHYRWEIANFHLSSTLGTEVFSLPYLLWQGISVHNGRLRVPLTLTIVAEHLAVELSLPILVCGDRDSNTKPSACKGNALTGCATPPSTATRSLTRRDVAKIKWSGELVLLQFENVLFSLHFRFSVWSGSLSSIYLFHPLT